MPPPRALGDAAEQLGGVRRGREAAPPEAFSPFCPYTRLFGVAITQNGVQKILSEILCTAGCGSEDSTLLGCVSVMLIALELGEHKNLSPLRCTDLLVTKKENRPLQTSSVTTSPRGLIAALDLSLEQ